MGKDKKKPKLKIKTARYFTKTCSACNTEYPNWFVLCPNCKSSEIPTNEPTQVAEDLNVQKKTIKIVVKITEEDFEEEIQNVQLLFSADQGKTWFQMGMDVKMDYFIAEIAEVPIDAVIIYYIQVHLVSGEIVTENNGGQYFYYRVGGPIQLEEKPPETEEKQIQDNIASASMETKKYKSFPEPEIESESSKEQVPKEEEGDDDITIFGRSQTQIDPNLKVCPHCNSKIKNMWSICPICGGKVK